MQLQYVTYMHYKDVLLLRSSNALHCEQLAVEIAADETNLTAITFRRAGLDTYKHKER